MIIISLSFLVLNCCRLLTRLLPYLYEDSDWYGFFWSQTKPRASEDETPIPLAQLLLCAVCVSLIFHFNSIVPHMKSSICLFLQDLLFCPDFTVAANKKSGPVSCE